MLSLNCQFLSRPVLYLAWAAVVSVLTKVGIAEGEFRCSVDISYRWSRRPVESAPVVASSNDGNKVVAPQGAAKTSNGAQTSPTPFTVAPTPEPAVVRLLGVERSGTDEAAAKANLQMEVDRYRIRASETCQRDHESYGTCTALKLSSKASILNSLSFSARSELEKALSDECRQQEGTCLGVDVSEPRCREVVQASAPAAVESPKGEEPKGAEAKAADGKAANPKGAKTAKK